MFGCTTRLTFFFFNDTATTEIYTLSLHDALPIFRRPLLQRRSACHWSEVFGGDHWYPRTPGQDRKSTRLNSSHDQISYAVFCLKKKKRGGARIWQSIRTPYRRDCTPTSIQISSSP